MHDISCQQEIDLMGPVPKWKFETIQTNLTSDNVISNKYTELRVSSISPDSNGKYKKYFPSVYPSNNIFLKILNEDSKNLYLVCNVNQKFCDVYDLSGTRSDDEIVIRSGEEMLFSVRLDKYGKFMIIPIVI